MSLLTPEGDSPEELRKKLDYLKRLKEQVQEKEAGLTDEDRRIREECEGSLATFIRYGWKHIDTAVYKDNWHISAIAEHLEAMVRGDINHFLCNIPPRCMKSILASVSLVPWIWAQRMKSFRTGPETSLLYASYGHKLSLEHSLKTRTLLNSPFYKKMWGSQFEFLKDQNTVTKFSNTKGGYRIATSVGGALIGQGANIIGVDDPHNTAEVESDDVRQGVIDWWDTGLSTRLNDPIEGRFFVIMQRLHQLDLSGHILDQNEGEWTHLMLPMEYDPQRHCYIKATEFSDPRTEEGELLWPDRIDEKALATLKKKLGPYASSGQLQQMPAPKGGGIIKQEYWQELDSSYNGYFPALEFVIASCDTAYSKKEESDPSACTVWGVYRDRINNPKIIIMDAWEAHLGLHDLVLKIVGTCKRFKVDRLVIEGKASGLSVEQEIRRLFANENFGIVITNPTQDKQARLMAVEPLYADEMVFYPMRKDADTGEFYRPKWVDLVIDQVTLFPRAARDDITDTVSQGIKFLRDQGLAILREEGSISRERSMQHIGQKTALYDV